MKTGNLLTVHKSTTLVLVLSHMNPFQAIPFYFSKIHFNNIIQYMPRSCSGLYPSGQPLDILHIFLVSVLRATCLVHLTRLGSRQLYDLGKQDTSRKVSSFTSSHSYVRFTHILIQKLFDSLPFSKAPQSTSFKSTPEYVIPMMKETKFHTHTKQHKKLHIL